MEPSDQHAENGHVELWDRWLMGQFWMVSCTSVRDLGDESVNKWRL